ncbi:MAG: hypothetical protein RLZZ597_34 [Cyanobacteriota bacterium]|jgi:hypothetical protein
MAYYVYRFSGQMLKSLAAGLCTLALVGVALFGVISPALAVTEGSLSEAMTLKMDKAAQEFVASILDEYEDTLSDAFKETLKPLKSVTKDLTKQLSKIAISPTADTTTLDPQLAASQTVLETATAAFQALIDDTAAFKANLATTPDQLKAAIDTQIGTKFDDLQAAFEGVSEALATLSSDTTALDLTDTTAAVGKLTEDSTALAQAIELAKTTIGSFGD